VRSSGVHHVDLVVSSIERSLPFYRELLAPLGYHRVGEVEGERGETIWYFSGPGTAIGVRQAQSESAPYDRYAVLALGRRRAGGVAALARGRDRERARGVPLPARLLRGLLLRPRRT